MATPLVRDCLTHTRTFLSFPPQPQHTSSVRGCGKSPTLGMTECLKRRVLAQSISLWLVLGCCCLLRALSRCPTRYPSTNWASETHQFVHQAHYAHGIMEYTGLNTSALRPLACVRNVIPVSSFTIRFVLLTIKVSAD